MGAPRFRTWLPPAQERSRLAIFQCLVLMEATCSESQRNAFADVVCTEPFCFLYMVGGSRRDPQNSLSLARLRSAPRLCTWTSPRRWATQAGAGMSLWGITGLCRISAFGCHLHERGRGWPPFCILYLVVMQATCSESQRNAFAKGVCTE